MEKLEREGALLLSLSELIELKVYFSGKSRNQQEKLKDVKTQLVVCAFENEKVKLLQEIAHLKETLSKIQVSFFFF